MLSASLQRCCAEPLLCAFKKRSSHTQSLPRAYNMDILQTTVVSGTLLYRFIVSCADFSVDARSLAVRFDWDIRILSQLLKFFEDRQSATGGQLSQGDQDLLDKSLVYLTSLMEMVASKRCKIEASRWWGTQLNRARWFHHKKELTALEQELFQWTARFDLRLVAFPDELKGVLQLDLPTRDCTPRLATKIQIDKYFSSSEQHQIALREALLVNDVGHVITFRSQIPSRRRIAAYKNTDAIIEYKPHGASILQEQTQLEELTIEVGNLAVALSFVDPTITGLLRCDGYFHEATTDNPRFGFVYKTPYPLRDENPPTLKDLLKAKDPTTGNRQLPLHALDKRMILVKRIAAALYFLHAVGWVHKSIRSNNILVLEDASLPADKIFPHGLGRPFLVNFETSRTDTATTDLTLAEKEDEWHLNVYRHPTRQGKNISVRFTMAHDVYSLGVVMLEIGLWRPIERSEKTLKGKSAVDVQKELIQMANGVATNMGSKYRDLVIWCLELEDENLGTSGYVVEILEKLDSLVL